MPNITLDPHLRNFFVEMDWRERAAAGQAFDDRLVRHYEAGDVILLKNPPFRIASDIFHRIRFPAGDEFKKLHAQSLLLPKLYKPKVAKFFFGVFGADMPLYFGFRRAVNDLTAQLTDFVTQVFRTYRFLTHDVNWRFSPTGPEPLHFDYPSSTTDLQYVRVFVNLDDAPRIWRVGPQLEELIEQYYDEAGLDALQGAHPNVITERITFEILERWREKGTPAPRHHVEFLPGEVWICESRINSHEIYSGNRAVITHFHADPRSMLDPEQRVSARVERAMARAREARAAKPSPPRRRAPAA